MLASTASVYGANVELPFREMDKADSQITLYAATKKSNEAMSHSHAHIYGIPTTVFRFFSVYGPWGRPDMALFKFTKNILQGDAIDLYNSGNMSRDFTYIDDIVVAIMKLIDSIPGSDMSGQSRSSDSLSKVGPHRIVNIGNSNMIQLLEFVEAIEEATGLKAKRNYLPMQTGDVPKSFSDSTLLYDLTSFKPNTDFRLGVRNFVNWFRDYYKM